MSSRGLEGSTDSGSTIRGRTGPVGPLTAAHPTGHPCVD